MAALIQIRRDTAANWTSSNPILASGELGIETDTGKTKIGNGVTAWNSKVYDWQTTIGAQDLWIGAPAMWSRGTNGCSSLIKTEIATSLFNIQSLDFDATTQEFAQISLALPRNWDHGTITAKVYWTATSGSGSVVWGVSGGAYSDDDALTVAFGTAVTITDTLIAANDLHISAVSGAITLAGSPADSDFLALQISRNPADGSDTLAVDAKMLGIMLTIITDASIAQ